MDLTLHFKLNFLLTYLIFKHYLSRWMGLHLAETKGTATQVNKVRKTTSTYCLSVTKAISPRQGSGIGRFPYTASCQSHKPVPCGFEHCVQRCSACSLTIFLNTPARHFHPASVPFKSWGKQMRHVIPVLFAWKPTSQALTLA